MMEHHLNALIGVPYARNGRDPAVALDCWGVVLLDAKARGLALPVFDDECPPAKTAIARKMRSLSEVYAQAILQPVDGCMAYDPRRAHVGMFYGGRVFHAAEGAGVCSDRLDNWLLLYPHSEFWAWRQ